MYLPLPMQYTFHSQKKMKQKNLPMVVHLLLLLELIIHRYDTVEILEP